MKNRKDVLVALVAANSSIPSLASNKPVAPTHDKNMTVCKFASKRPTRNPMAVLCEGDHRSARDRPFSIDQTYQPAYRLWTRRFFRSGSLILEPNAVPCSTLSNFHRRLFDRRFLHVHRYRATFARMIFAKVESNTTNGEIIRCREEASRVSRRDSPSSVGKHDGRLRRTRRAFL